MENILDPLAKNESTLARLTMKTYDEDGNIITQYNEEKGWFEEGMEQNAYGELIMTRTFHPYTQEQLSKIQLEKDKAALVESRKQFTQNEVIDFLLRENINNLDIPDHISLRMMGYYPSFDKIIGRTVKMGFKFVHDGKMYKTVQPEVTIQSVCQPSGKMESLYELIDFTHIGTIYDPIPYDESMRLEKNKYYTQNDKIYFCYKDTIDPIYVDLKRVVDIYVKMCKGE